MLIAYKRIHRSVPVGINDLKSKGHESPENLLAAKGTNDSLELDILHDYTVPNIDSR